MSILSRLFGGGGGASEPASEPETYEGFTIQADPIREGSTYRIAARIEKNIGGELKKHQLIRADTLEGRDAAIEASLQKAKQVIDEQGDRLFG